MMTARETRRMDDIEWAHVGAPYGTDHRKLTNEELHGLLCAKNPQMASIHVTDDIRETIIAMIEILE